MTAPYFYHYPNYVWTLLEDRKGNLWIGTLADGLCLFERKTQQFIRFMNRPGDPTSLSNNRIFALGEDQEGNVWAGTDLQGLNRVDATTQGFTRYQHDEKKSNSPEPQLCQYYL